MIRLILCGVVIGIANTIPGVSGGTMAVILKIYDKIISSITNLRADFVNSCKTLIPLGIGGVLGIFAFANLIEYALEKFPVITGFLFLGLVLGSIPSVNTKIEEEGLSRAIEIPIVLVCWFIMYIMYKNRGIEGDVLNIYTDLDTKTFLILFITSVIAGGTMIIPGISGSFMLLLLGSYHTILNAVANLNIGILIPVALGCIVGVLLFAKAIDILFRKFKGHTYSAIAGLMYGSLLMIIPPWGFNVEGYMGIGIALATAYFVNKFA